MELINFTIDEYRKGGYKEVLAYQDWRKRQRVNDKREVTNKLQRAIKAIERYHKKKK